jgi:hypothetical protein
VSRGQKANKERKKGLSVSLFGRTTTAEDEGASNQKGDVF